MGSPRDLWFALVANGLANGWAPRPMARHHDRWLVHNNRSVYLRVQWLVLKTNGWSPSSTVCLQTNGWSLWPMIGLREPLLVLETNG